MRKKGSGVAKSSPKDVLEFVAEDASPLATSDSYSSRFIRPDSANAYEADTWPAAEPTTTDDPAAEVSPAFRLLSEPALPELPRENRARLQMQSPNKLYFYWSLKDNPYKNLNGILGAQAANYTLVLKLVDVAAETESLQPADGEGSWWFDVDDGREYRAEVGLYAFNRPHVRILFSNTVETPRRGPSPRLAESAEWRVPSNRFSQVLDAAGFTRDAFDVALSGDDASVSDAAARSAFVKYLGHDAAAGDQDRVRASDIRLGLLTFAAGGTLAALRGRIGPSLFEFLSGRSIAEDPARAASVLSEHYDIETTAYDEKTETTTVFGGSLLHFPRRVQTRRRAIEFLHLGRELMTT